MFSSAVMAEHLGMLLCHPRSDLHSCLDPLAGILWWLQLELLLNIIAKSASLPKLGNLGDLAIINKYLL